MLQANLILSRPSYQAGTPVVGTVQITRTANDEEANNNYATTRTSSPIRDEIVSARLYLAGRAYLGSNSQTGGKVGSRWRSIHEINQLKRIYGEHACLTLAKMEETSCWQKNDGKWNNTICDTDNDDCDLHNNNFTKETSFRKVVEPPQVTHIEQGERFAVHSFLHPLSATSVKTNDNNTECCDYTHLPTPHENNTICFWMTNILELINIPERHLDQNCTKCCSATDTLTDDNAATYECDHLRSGRGKFYGDMHPYRPLQIPDLNVVREEIEHKQHGVKVEEAGQRGKSEEESRSIAAPALPSAWERVVASAASHRVGNDISTKDNDETPYSKTPLEHNQLALSFRANLPPDIPPTMSAECVKYFYSAVLVVTTAEGELLVTQCPYTVLTPSSSHHSSNQRQQHQTSTTRVHIGDVQAIAHSAGLPTYISSTEASDATPSQLTVIVDPPACDIVSRRTAEHRTSTHRIVDGTGSLCGLMTMIGVGGDLVPGTRIGIRVQFPIDENDESSNEAGIIPCHRVCCALVGEEYAEGSDSSTHNTAGADPNSKGGKKRVKTRSYVFDSTYELVEFGYTEAISMGLVLPLDCPVTVKTDLVEVTVTLKVEFTVSRSINSSQNDGIQKGGEGDFHVIRLDLPCEVVHSTEQSSGYAGDVNEENQHISSIRTMQRYWNNTNRVKRDYEDGFDDTDIQADMKALSLRMIEKLPT